MLFVKSSAFRDLRSASSADRKTAIQYIKEILQCDDHDKIGVKQLGFPYTRGTLSIVRGDLAIHFARDIDENGHRFIAILRVRIVPSFTDLNNRIS